MTLSTNVGSVFSFKKRLNNFNEIRDNFELLFLMAATGIVSRLLAFIGSRLLINSETFRVIMKIFLRL